MPSQTNYQNLLQIFEATVSRQPRRDCFRFLIQGQWQSLSWERVRYLVTGLASALESLGVVPGDRVGILSKTRFEWSLADFGVITSGAVSVPLHDSATPVQISHIIQHANVRVVFVENEILIKKLGGLAETLKIICFENNAFCRSPHIWLFDAFITMGYETTERLGQGRGLGLYEHSLKTLTSSDTVTIVYTSGTTGEPKGVVLTHGNFIAEILSAVEVFKFTPSHVTLAFLPYAHILGRVTEFFHLKTGYIQCFAESLEKIMDNVQGVKPHFMVAVPRLLEKMHARIIAAAGHLSPRRKKIFFWSLGIGLKAAQKKLGGQRFGFLLKLQSSLANLLVFKKIRQRLGGRFEFFVSGGAPLAIDVGLFFYACGIKILEGYGLTETTAAISVNRHELIKFGTVGPAIGETQFKVAADGEILTRGPMVFREYYRDPFATAEAFDPDGWFKTGDIGELDSEGYLTLTDRKKDIIVTAGGKNIAPQHVENTLKANPFISQCVVHGDRRKFLSALITLDREQILKYADDHRLQFRDYQDLVTSPHVYDLIRQQVAERNTHLASFETIKKFAILPTEFSIEAGDLTVSLKLRRKDIEKKCASILNSFYEEETVL